MTEQRHCPFCGFDLQESRGKVEKPIGVPPRGNWRVSVFNGSVLVARHTLQAASSDDAIVAVANVYPDDHRIECEPRIERTK